MAAYRSGLRLIDERTGEICDYTRKRGIIETSLIFPNGVSFDRQTLWNMAEQAEKRKDARIAREIRVALPHELSEKERSKLANEFVKQLVEKYQIAVDLSLHQPDRQGDNRNFHAHLLLTTRQITPEGLSDKSDLEKSDKALKQLGLMNGKEQITAIREEWEMLCNIALERQGREERISAKSYKARNIEKEPTIHLGPAVTAMERRGIETELGTLNRIITKTNLSHAVQREIDRLKQGYKAISDKILEIKDDLKKEISQYFKPEPQTQKKPLSIDQLLTDGARKMPDNGQELNKQDLSVENLLNSQKEQQETLEKEAEERRKLSVEELLNRKEPERDKGLSRDQDGIER